MATTTYKQPKSVPVDKSNGYPNDIKSTQTMRTKGTYAIQTKGKNFNPNPGKSKP
jgi:hypothetical protein